MASTSTRNAQSPSYPENTRLRVNAKIRAGTLLRADVENVSRWYGPRSEYFAGAFYEQFREISTGGFYLFFLSPQN